LRVDTRRLEEWWSVGVVTLRSNMAESALEICKFHANVFARFTRAIR